MEKVNIETTERKGREEESKYKNYFQYIARSGKEELLKWLEKNGFFEAPASTKYHGAYKGGLVEHSNNVFNRLLRLAQEEDIRNGRQQEKYTLDTLATVALLHDVCKMDAYKTEKRNQKTDGKWQEVEQYTYTNNFPIGHSEKSIIQIMRYIDLSNEEIMAIRWHMGRFDAATKGGSYEMNYAFAQSELAVMLHIADMMATHLDEREVLESEQQSVL